MKTSLAAIPAILAAWFMSGPLPAADAPASPAEALHTAQVASFISRVAYAKAKADPVIYGDKSGGTLSCIVYIVKQGAGGGPGYAVVVATDKSFAPMDDIAVVCDAVGIDPAHFIKCSGHVFSAQSGWFTVGGDGMVIQLGLGKKDRVLKITGPRRTAPI